MGGQHPAEPRAAYAAGFSNATALGAFDAFVLSLGLFLVVVLGCSSCSARCRAASGSLSPRCCRCSFRLRRSDLHAGPEGADGAIRFSGAVVFEWTAWRVARGSQARRYTSTDFGAAVLTLAYGSLAVDQPLRCSGRRLH